MVLRAVCTQQTHFAQLDLSRSGRKWSCMKRLLLAAALCLLTGCSANYRDQSVEVMTEPTLDLERYAGLWYEVARFPNFFERGCVAATAEYTPRPDGRITVLNSCRDGALDGELKQAEGVARIAGDNPARLEVSFTPYIPFAWADYWVLDIDPDYTVAVIGSPGGGLGWVLARDRALPPARVDAALQVLARNGYDISQVERFGPDGAPL